MKLHIVPGINDIANGMVVVARLLAKEQGDAEVVDLSHGIHRIHGSDVDEVWVHGMWLPREWAACRMALKAGAKLVRMTHGSLSPIYLERQSKWKKRLVSPIERHYFAKCDRVVVTGDWEEEWCRAWGLRGPFETVDLKRFFDFSLKARKERKDDSRVERVERVERGALHLLYLGRRHPLKGVEYLEEAIKSLSSVYSVSSVVQKPELRIVSSAFGEELEKVWDWCDVLVLPTLSENFGLVIAEALERGKRVITTDGAPAWGDGDDYGGRLIYLKGYRDGTKDERVGLLRDALKEVLARVSSQGGK